MVGGIKVVAEKSDMAELWLVVGGSGRFCVRACGDGLKMGNLAPRKEKKISRLYFFDIL